VTCLEIDELDTHSKQNGAYLELVEVSAIPTDKECLLVTPRESPPHDEVTPGRDTQRFDTPLRNVLIQCADRCAPRRAVETRQQRALVLTETASRITSITCVSARDRWSSLAPGFTISGHFSSFSYDVDPALDIDLYALQRSQLLELTNLIFQHEAGRRANGEHGCHRLIMESSRHWTSPSNTKSSPHEVDRRPACAGDI
jgi:hypothetical protein